MLQITQPEVFTIFKKTLTVLEVFITKPYALKNNVTQERSTGPEF